MPKRKRDREQRTTPQHHEPEPKSEEDLQARDASEIPDAPQNPVDPGPELPS
ncbi:MAG TPA: hypothetical protein VM093_09080 [Aeromicrobium sp.]|nr:hypothetical protein [Aeromicrobium sp.]